MDILGRLPLKDRHLSLISNGKYIFQFIFRKRKKNCTGKAATKQSLFIVRGKPNQTTIKNKIKTNMIHEITGMGNDSESHKSRRGGAGFFPCNVFCCKEKFANLTNHVCACTAEPFQCKNNLLLVQARHRGVV